MWNASLQVLRVFCRYPSKDVEIGQTVPRIVDANASILNQTASDDTAPYLSMYFPQMQFQVIV